MIENVERQVGVERSISPLRRADVELLRSNVESSAQFDLSFQNLQHIDLSCMDLQWANLHETDLQEANLCEADCDGADQ
jgi:uncharacterized protein YjbI with pentapeptide repeats